MQATPPPSAPTEPGYAEVRRLDLQAAFHTKAPWVVYAPGAHRQGCGHRRQPGEDLLPANPRRPAGLHRRHQRPRQRYPGLSLPDPRRRGRPRRAARSGRAEGRNPGAGGEGGGGEGDLFGRRIGDAEPRPSSGPIPAARPKASFRPRPPRSPNLGETRRFASGPMAGYYLTADFIWGDKETHWDPHRFTIDAYRLDKNGGYLKVLSYLTTGKYPAERQDRRLCHRPRIAAPATPVEGRPIRRVRPPDRPRRP